MTKAYINYPEPHVTLHADQRCPEIGKMRKPNQRHAHVNITSFSREVQDLTSKSFRFGADSSINDLWISVDFNDRQFEKAVIDYIHQRLVSRYTPLGRVHPQYHCR